jgi:hypothetical protein
MLGVAAATALPSEIFPFRKIFLPMVPRITRVDMLDLPQWGKVEAIELEAFAKEIPDLIYRSDSLYKLLKKNEMMTVSSRSFRIPLRDNTPPGQFIWTPNEDQARAIAKKQAQGIDVQAAIDALV